MGDAPQARKIQIHICKESVLDHQAIKQPRQEHPPPFLLQFGLWEATLPCLLFYTYNSQNRKGKPACYHCPSPSLSSPPGYFLPDWEQVQREGTSLSLPLSLAEHGSLQSCSPQPQLGWGMSRDNFSNRHISFSCTHRYKQSRWRGEWEGKGGGTKNRGEWSGYWEWWGEKLPWFGDFKKDPSCFSCSIVCLPFIQRVGKGWEWRDATTAVAIVTAYASLFSRSWIHLW